MFHYTHLIESIAKKLFIDIFFIHFLTKKKKICPGDLFPDRSNIPVCFFFSSRTVRIYP